MRAMDTRQSLVSRAKAETGSPTHIVVDSRAHTGRPTRRKTLLTSNFPLEFFAYDVRAMAGTRYETFKLYMFQLHDLGTT